MSKICETNLPEDSSVLFCLFCFDSKNFLHYNHDREKTFLLESPQSMVVHDGPSLCLIYVVAFDARRGTRDTIIANTIVTTWRVSWLSCAWKVTRHMAKQSYSVSIGKGGYANGETCHWFSCHTCHRCHVYL
jgi:hypothetical protein